MRELGYPSRMALHNWYNEYKGSNNLHTNYNRKYKYSPEQKQVAVNYLLP